MHLTSPPPQPPRPQILHNLFSFLLSITADPTEIENNGWAKFVGGGGGGEISCIMGDVQVAFLQILPLIGSQKALLSLETLWRRGE